ncbi:Fe2+-enterobactin ABC transporter substrate-binding protein [Arthrobacter sp. BL-252-APC-1A]|uniref:Fe2+-enterobactin ABC transporter substrate-binding protein n=1 Tax=Arthrobacter sp. BL-252-APC-1A TaxID=2606622 RepID=UPI0012B1FC59|nr:Fe2+-enterobactin ABC transporter substrate-binding protein [Arthrobacter sp. BL-252-APC-1A]MSS00227.1 Fe2+-enterobactin ABC transporter substrate-binding protein [Arthrobacter sp. BL-252-APC-1A]
MRFPLPKKALALSATAVLALTLGACSSEAADADPAASSSPSTEWPRTITHEAGETVIDAMPETIVSTSLSVTGTLLAIDAPVTATSVSTARSGTADENGFFSQWADVAVERGVEPLYTIGELDLEAVIAEDPDLIVVSTSGADSVLDQYDALSDIAPTIVVNYGDQTWQDLAVELGEATGLEDKAVSVVEEFDSSLAEAARKLDIAEGTTASIVSYNAGDVSPVGKGTGPHSQLLTALGFTVAEPDEQYDTSTQKREDFTFTSYEGLSASVTGDYTFLISSTEKTVEAFTADPTLANLPSVQAGKVYSMGPESFRLDYFSASDIVEWFTASFPAK